MESARRNGASPRWIIVVLTATTACSSGGDTEPPGRTDGGMMSSSDGAADCDEALSCRGGALCCDVGEECVDGLYCQPACEHERCGENGGLCCGAEQRCIDGVACAARCEEAEELCGSSLELCCAIGELCLNDACQAPGRECEEDFECWDAALYCEPTLGRCLRAPTEPLCEVRPPPPGDFSMTVERHFTGVTIDGVLYDRSDGVPLVGDVSGDGVPDIVTTLYAASFSGPNALVAFSGDDLRVHFQIADGADGAERYSVALANFDPSDPALEIVYCAGATGDLRLIRGNGEEITRRSGGCHGSWTSLEVADVNADGTPDVVSGCSAYDGRALDRPEMDLFDVPCDYTIGGAIPFQMVLPSVADLDGDERPEVTLGGIAVNDDGSTLWRFDDANGYTAVADLDGNGTPEVVISRLGEVLIRDGRSGEVTFGPIVLPGGDGTMGPFAPSQGIGGPPTVADFDRDGLPEVGVAAAVAYSVIDPDCASTPYRTGGECRGTMGEPILWFRDTQDESSNMTGSSVFDFQGDGAAEVLYNDECFLYVLDGTTGVDLIEPVPNTTHTFLEYPVVADADGDGQSELVVTANPDHSEDDCAELYAARLGVMPDALDPALVAGTRGVFIFGDPSDGWVPTRALWNQYSYHVTNVEDDGGVPAVEPNNWAYGALNNYRQNVQVGAYNRPDLVVELEASPRCAFETVNVQVRVRNVGSRGAPAGIRVSVGRVTADGSLADQVAVSTTMPLLPGAEERIGLEISDVPFDEDLTFEASLDIRTDELEQCGGDDERARVTARCDTLI